MTGRPLYVDDRYVGNHGIARYAREVVSRLARAWTPLQGRSAPGSPLEVLDRHRLGLRPDVVLYSPGFATGPSRATQLLTIHDLTHLRGSGPRGQLQRAYYEMIIKPVVRKAGHVITVSETSAADLRDWLGDAVHVHNGGNGCSGAFMHDHGATAMERPYFLYVGNFKAHKNPGPLFAAMRSFPDHLLVVVTSDQAAATRFARDHAVGHQLLVRSDVADVELSRLYRGAEALVFPSVWEGFGLPVVEALTTGTKVVHSRVAASVAEICRDSQFAVSDAGDPDELAEQMLLATRSPFVRPRSLDDYNWDHVAAKVEAVINAHC